MSTRHSRRTFLGGLGSASAATLLPGGLRAAGSSPNGIPNIASVGVGGKGWVDANGAAVHANIVAFCDVETTQSRRRGGFSMAASKWPKARRYTDWREMLDREQDLDGITVSTPDHMHAPITMTALRKGIACYTQKPLTRTVHESRRIAEAAREAGVATQMGNQHHNGRTYLTLVKLLRSGVIGKVRTAHAWSNRPIWPQGHGRPEQSHDPPSSLAWDLWLGVAPARPYAPGVYHPFKWRGWYDFGSGALGDMGCHIIDPVHWALELTAPISVSYEGPPPAKETFPAWERIHYEFPGSRHTAGRSVGLTWHDGNRKPDPAECNLPGDARLPNNGCLFVGEKGVVVASHGSQDLPSLYPKKVFADYEIEVVDGRDHYEEWIDGIKGEGRPSSHFDYAGPLCETVLLGCVASRVAGAKLEWDSKSLKFSNSAAANDLLHQEYRKGWEVEGLA
ncbi:MAG: Gfo/Idh/MocA family oxidoreductase [Akkermansiaceae bacterium]|nr:Gfo/Idh/MocA family oxidoreductase [Akkermansiaceae bacterium]